ncbi:hypothetical protein Zmor_014387 [Zophobas morio]|uniref:Uncharacterized protein n=1 Tax=Zophobas morio TaxID=2755281 RepID=A0AA38MGG4_9CUCU|nr:hypothetical protein Zmor_014387 [Zophobas morio]
MRRSRALDILDSRESEESERRFNMNTHGRTKPLSLHNYVSCQIITCGGKPISDELSRTEQHKLLQQIGGVAAESRVSL